MSEFAIIDAHQHCWQLANTRWPTPDLATIYRDFGPPDFLAACAGGKVAGSVLVQSQPTAADTDYLLAQAEAHPHILGVVGWIDLAADDAPEQIARRAAHPAFCGVRPMLQALPDDAWIAGPQCDAGLEALAAHKLCFDALICSRHLPYIERIAIRHPNLSIVLDHGAKPDIAAGQWHPWHQGLSRLAALPNVWCKLSGLITEARAGADMAAVQPYAEAILQLFGPRRVIWGSDWPVLNLATSYDQWLAYCKQLVQLFTKDSQAAILRDNAVAFYDLKTNKNKLFEQRHDDRNVSKQV